MNGYTDIRRHGWVAKLPASFEPYILLARFDRPVGIWLLFLPGLWAICLTAPGLWRGLWLAVLFALGAAVMRGAGCVVNDIWDRDLDSQVERTKGRPLAAGHVRLWQAFAFLGGLCLIGLLVLLALPPVARWLGVGSLVLVALYPAAKRVTWWPQMMLGLTFGFGAPLGFAAAHGGLGWGMVPLYGSVIFWILGYDTIYAHQDRVDDAIVGVKSTARLFEHHTKAFLAVCYGTTLALLLVSLAMARLNMFAYAGLVPPAALLMAQIFALDIHDPAKCLRLFKSNREVGLLVAVAILVGRLSL
ncbi:4-hydroxybenzoate octaprenyltransferase [Acidocella sp.]|uniref:4-hydroxybenzoate octaprenyltransferase n=1 Tax=Acidocella sp. TaxID=50710 RepID=UPI002615899F|nr:4-hydroxybenzoate octaprenyltransferase [Acidocella sp.]